MNTFLKLTFGLAALFVLGLIYSGCGDDEEGSEAPNEKFIGNYEGSFSCTAPFDVIDEDLVEFEISPPVDPNETSKVTISFVVTGIPISLEGQVSGNNLSFSDISLDNIPFDIGGGMEINVTLTFSGGASISGDVLTANLNVIADLGGGITQASSCTLVGMKV